VVNLKPSVKKDFQGSSVNPTANGNIYLENIKSGFKNRKK
jgi:hypothetical protein